MSSFIDHRGDGSNKSFLIPFEYYENDQLFAYVDDKLVEIEQYNKNSIVLKDIPPNGSLVRIRRIVDVDTPFATYVTGSDLTEDTLNKNNLKLLYGIQQLNDGFIDDDFYFKQDISMGDNRIIDVADGIDDTDAVNYSQVKNLDANVKQIEQNIIRLEQQAKASKDAAGVSENNAKQYSDAAKVSETNSKTSETNSKVSEINAKDSELLAKQYEDASKVSETNAKNSELLSKQYSDAAKVSETNSKTSETNAKESELLSKQYADAAKVSETNSKTSETNSKTSETNAKTSETNAKDSELLAKKYADESKSTKPDYKTIFIDTEGNIAAKDIIINGDDSDLASNRGQIGKAVLLTDAYSSITDLNTVLKSGIYWITNGIAATLQNCPTSGIGGFLIVSGNETDTTQQTYHVYNSSNIYTRYIINGTANSWNKVIIDTDSATTSKKGIVQLSSAVNSNSETIAATSKAVKLAYDKADEALTKTGLPLGHIYLWPFSTPPDGSIQLNGSTYSRELYSDLWALIQEKNWYKPESEWQSIASANGGYCPWYSDGDGSTTFRTPKFAPYQKLALVSGDAGKYYEAGLPNITGDYTKTETYRGYYNGNFSGAFVGKPDIYNSNLGGGTGSNLEPSGWIFDASLSNPIYGNSTTVRPESNDWIVCAVAFGTATNVGSVDVANVMSAVGQVQANPNLQGTAHIVKTWKSSDGSSWYRKYSDGFIEQSGKFTGGSSKSVTLVTPFSSSSYTVITQIDNANASSSVQGTRIIGNKSKTSFVAHSTYADQNGSSAINPNVTYYACGY